VLVVFIAMYRPYSFCHSYSWVCISSLIYLFVSKTWVKCT